MKTLRSIAKRLELRGYSRLRKSQLTDFIVAGMQSTLPPWSGAPGPPPPPPPPPWSRTPSGLPLPPRPRPPSPPPQSVRFRPDRPRQPELLRKLEERNPQPLKPPALKPYQLKPKRGKEPPMEQKESPPTNPKKIKHMKKKLDELNRKIRHSRKKHDGLIH